MKPGDLYQSNRRHLATRKDDTVVQIIKTWNKRDIDPECPESVAIIPMVQYVVWQAGQPGGTFNYQRGSFHRRYTKVEAEQ